jgi:DNA-binding MarR family transcriptional regulator
VESKENGLPVEQQHKGNAWETTLRTVAGLLRVFETTLQKELDLPLAWFDVLTNLNAVPGGRMRMQTLAESLILTRSGVTRLVDRVEKAGLVQREPAAEDRRGYYAILTEAGKSMVQRAHEIHGRDIDENFTRYLTQREMGNLYSMMQKVWTGNPALLGSRQEA